MPPVPKLTRDNKIAFLVFFMSLAFFLGGLILGGKQPLIVDNDETSLLEQVISDIKENYIAPEKLNNKDMYYGSIEGLVNSIGDPYTRFVKPASNGQESLAMAGEYAGIGVTIYPSEKTKEITVAQSYKGSPAEKAGILAGDIILAVNGDSVANWSSDKISSAIRGEPNTFVTLGIKRGVEIKIFQVQREVVNIPNLSWYLIGQHTVYIKITSFSRDLPKELAVASSELLKNDVRGIILDFRGNGGGDLNSARDTADFFLAAESVLMRQVGRNGKELSPHLTPGRHPFFANTPLVVLVNGDSASASEVVASALRVHRQIPLVGEKTFGKGSTQVYINYTDGSSLHVTYTKWLTPDGTSINGNGLEPDEEVLIKPDDITSKRVVIGTVGMDPQLDRAIEILKKDKK